MREDNLDNSLEDEYYVILESQEQFKSLPNFANIVPRQNAPAGIYLKNYTINNLRLYQELICVGLNEAQTGWYTEIWGRKKIDSTWMSWRLLNSVLS